MLLRAFDINTSHPLHGREKSFCSQIDYAHQLIMRVCLFKAIPFTVIITVFVCCGINLAAQEQSVAVKCKTFSNNIEGKIFESFQPLPVGFDNEKQVALNLNKSDNIYYVSLTIRYKAEPKSRLSNRSISLTLSDGINISLAYLGGGKVRLANNELDQAVYIINNDDIDMKLLYGKITFLKFYSDDNTLNVIQTTFNQDILSIQYDCSQKLNGEGKINQKVFTFNGNNYASTDNFLSQGHSNVKFSIAKDGVKGYLYLRSDGYNYDFLYSKFGNCVIYLESLKSINLINRNLHSKVNGEISNIYYLTPAELDILRKYNIVSIRIEKIGSLFSEREFFEYEEFVTEDFRKEIQIYNTPLKNDNHELKQFHGTAFYINALFK